MCRMRTLVMFLCFITLSVSANDDEEDAEEKLVKKIIKECTESRSRLLCFSNKAAVFLERSINRDVPLFDGMRLVRNEEKVNSEGQGRSLVGFGRFKTALWNFLNAHRLSIDLTGSRTARQKHNNNNNNNNNQEISQHKIFYFAHDDDSDEHEHDEHDEKGPVVEVVYTKGLGGKGKGGGLSKGFGKGGGHFKGGGGGGDYDDYGEHSGGGGGGVKGGKKGKDKKYMYYAFMVLLGIFGLTGPLVMKTLAVIAAKALIASKMALIIVGSVMLKKLFEKDHHHPSVKVHTITAGDHEDEFDRLYSYNQVLPYPAHEHYARQPA